jgi:hypothetical protein
MPRDDIFLGDELNRIGEILNQTTGSKSKNIGSVWSRPILNECTPTSFHPDTDGNEAEWYKRCKCNSENEQ